MAINDNPIIQEMRQMYADARTDWRTQTTGAIKRMAEFAEVLGRNLGEISWDEAVDALKRFADEELEKVRNRS